ncbi:MULTISPECIES: hypothetical protein [Roseateles]|uniref:AtpZ/AtpI family protein n=1 Tax=Roseateles albus TaxID=2987525 RepID=A0ABT5K9N7_9BURK|nr:MULTISPECIES: hypothetical protein [Roseateles]MCV2357581.1 hypothetical protein [Paucibacter sp. TC2R-5]MDC8770643.1 hypothetical protein [Roseateles albus]
MTSPLKRAAFEGLADAAGFVLGALAGWQVGIAFGYDFINTPGWGLPQLTGLLFIVLGCGVGRMAFRHLLAKFLRSDAP